MKNMRLKLARVEMNLSQEELAAKVNVHALLSTY